MRAAVGLVLALLVIVTAGCAPVTRTVPPEAPITPPGWREHAVDGTDVALALPAEWLVFGDEELGDPDVRARLEEDFTGARGLFRAVASQGRRVRLVFLGVDPAARGAPTLPATVAVVAVRPRIPAVGLGLGADLVVDGLRHGLEMETDVSRRAARTPVGRAVQIGFEHRVADPTGGRGIRAALDAALVTSDRSSFLVIRNVDTADAGASTPSLEAVLRTLREASAGVP